MTSVYRTSFRTKPHIYLSEYGWCFLSPVGVVTNHSRVAYLKNVAYEFVMKLNHKRETKKHT